MRRSVKTLAVLSVSALVVALGFPAWAADPVDVDLELVLAVDVSRSMDYDEQQLQRDGYVNAFRHPDVIRAITEGPRGRIAVTLFEWAGTEFHSIVAPWTIIASREDSEAFADKIAATPFTREIGTSISSGLMFGLGQFDFSGARGDRRTIDVSGDGANNMGMPVAPTRDFVVKRGVTINGLPIMLKPNDYGRFSVPNLDAYYADCVIGGPGAFMITVDKTDRFEIATRRKLVLEISGLPAQLIRAAEVEEEAGKPGADCLAGEKARGLPLPFPLPETK
jgi:hypothetical protein